MYDLTVSLRDKVFTHYVANQPDPCIEELKKWLDTYQLNRDWVVKQIEETFSYWQIAPDLAKLKGPRPLWHQLFEFVMRRNRPPDGPPFSFVYLTEDFEVTPQGAVPKHSPGGWNVELQPKEEFIADAKRQFEMAVLDYCANQEREAEGRGLKKVKRSRNRKISLRCKMTWTVQRWCGRMQFEEIAQAHYDATGDNVDVSTITKNVNELSLLIDLE